MSTTLDEARKDMIAFGYDADEIERFEALARAVAEEVYAAALERLDALSGLGSALADIGLDGGDFDEEIAQLSRAPVGEDMPPLCKGTHPSHQTRFSDASSFDEVCERCGATDASGDDRLSHPCSTPPAKDTGADEIIADLEQRLVEAKTERDEARSSLETAKRRIGELEAEHDKALVVLGRHVGAMPDLSNVIAWLDAGCEPKKAADELRIYEKRIAALTPDAGTARSAEAEEE